MSLAGMDMIAQPTGQQHRPINVAPSRQVRRADSFATLFCWEQEENRVARKKSVKASAKCFNDKADDLIAYVAAASSLGDEHQSWCHEYAIIRLYRELENLMLEALTGAINNDTSTISTTVGISFPAHLTDEICEFLIIRNGYFDFKGRDGLIKTLKQYVPADHYLVKIVKKGRYRDALEQLSALRNYAAHASYQSKNAAKKVTGHKRMSSCGAWLKKQGRFGRLASQLKEMAAEIQNDAPY
jgi:hypothetical protein